MPGQTICGVTIPTEEQAIGVTAIAAGYEWECPTCGTWNDCKVSGPPAIGTRHQCSECSTDVVIEGVVHPGEGT